MAVTLANNLLPLANLSPWIRNTNVASDHNEVKSGPHAIVRDGAQWRCWFEGIEDTDPGTDDVTAPMMAAAPVLQGPWTVSPSTRLITPNSSPDWENDELSPSSAVWDAANDRWIVWYHGGNNGTYRRIGVMYSTDGYKGQAFTRDGANPILDKGTSGASDDLMVSDLKILRKSDGTYLGFYCGRQSGGPSNGTIHRVTGSSPNSLTKQGEVIAEGSGGSWNATGMYPSHVWIDPEDRLHMFCGCGDSTNGGIGYFYSDDDGANWTQYGSNPVATGSGTTTTFNEHIGDVTQVAHDGDVLLVTSGCYASAFTNPPLRGQGMWLTPARVTTPSKTGKFFLPTTGTQTHTAVTGASILSNSVGTIIGRFRAFRLTRSSQYRELYTESAAFNIESYWRIEGGAGGDAGKIGGWIRTPTGFTSGLVSLGVVDDGQWHVFMVRRLAGNLTELWLDGERQASSSATVNTDATTTYKAVGNWHPSAGVGDEPALCTLSDLVTIVGYACNWDEAAAILASRTFPPSVSATIDFPTAGTENGNVVTVEAAQTLTVTAHPVQVTVDVGGTGQFSVTATTTGGSLRYQWQVSTDGGVTWANVSGGSGATSATYTTATVSESDRGKKFRCVVSDDEGNYPSCGAYLMVPRVGLGRLL